MSEGGPILLATGRFPRWVASILFKLVFVGPIGLGVAVARMPDFELSSVPASVWGAGLAYLVLAYAVSMFAIRRSVRATFHETHIAFEGPVLFGTFGRHTLSYKDVVGFRDASADYLDLFDASALPLLQFGLLWLGTRHVVPTPDPEIRARALALLAERGVAKVGE